jgi:hypothetical protein
VESKEPVLLTVLVETANLRWFVAAVGLDGTALPLLRSEIGDLDAYIGLQFDEQVSFLRHRFSGVLQRGVDRLWPRRKKPCQIVFLFEGLLDRAPVELTQRVADHFVEWMSSPPVVAFASQNGFRSSDTPKLDKLAGEMDQPLKQTLDASLAALLAAMADTDLWELFVKKTK